MKLRMAFLVSVCAAGLLAGACGGSSSRSTSSSAAPTVAANKPAFLEQANSICKQYSDQVKRIVMPGDLTQVTAEQLPAWSSYFQQILPPIQKEQSDLRALTPPSGDASTINAILDDQAAGIEDLQALQRAAAQSDLPGFQAALSRFNQRFARVQAEARQYGLAECSN
jgi:hypothetical protein